MNCDKARQLIQQRLDEDRAGTTDWTELDTHLATCKTCTTEWEELQRTQALLQSVATDAPTTEEKETMWNAIAVAAPASRYLTELLGGRRAILEFAAASVGIAAVLMIALQVGQRRYGTEGRRLLSLANIKGTATSSRIYATDSASHSPLRSHSEHRTRPVGPVALFVDHRHQADTETVRK